MSHRDPLLQQLRAYREHWSDETAMTDRLIAFVEEHDDCFERSLAVGHVTGSAWLVNPAGTHVLLTHHKKLHLWFQLGGHVDGNPDTLDAALREAQEESGINRIEPVSKEIFDIDIHLIPAREDEPAMSNTMVVSMGIHLIPAREDEPAHNHHDIRYTFRAKHEAYVVGDESHDLAWVEIARLEEFTSEASMLRMARKWTSRTIL